MPYYCRHSSSARKGHATDAATFDQYVKQRVEPAIRKFDEGFHANDRTYHVLQWSVIILSAVTPALVSMDLAKFGSYFTILPVITSLLVAIFTSAMKTFNYQEKMISYRLLKADLRTQRYLYQTRTGDYAAASEPEALFIERVETILSLGNTLWVRTHQQTRDAHEDGGGGSARP